jgi:hypothetical protein
MACSRAKLTLNYADIMPAVPSDFCTHSAKYPIWLLWVHVMANVPFECYRQTSYQNLRHVTSLRMKRWDVVTRWPAICTCSEARGVPDSTRRMISENTIASPANSLTYSSEHEALDSLDVFQTTTWVLFMHATVQALRINCHHDTGEQCTFLVPC